MQICTLLQTDNHASTPPLSFLQAGCPSCRPTNSVKAVKAIKCNQLILKNVRMITNLATHKAKLSDTRVTNISEGFTHKTAAITSWHRYGTKLRHCHTMSILVCRWQIGFTFLVPAHPGSLGSLGQKAAKRVCVCVCVSCSSKIQIGFTFLVPAHLGSPGQRAVKPVCVCVVVGRLR